jgi:hypothetical protein
MVTFRANPLRIALRPALGIALVLVLGACGTGGPEAAGSGGPGGAGPARGTTAGSPATSATYAGREEATVALANPDAMVAAAGALWVKTDDGRVARIDPTTNAITDELTVDQVSDPEDYCQGIGADGTSVWACATRDDGTGVAQIDPGTRAVVRVLPAGKVFDQLAIPTTGRGVWLLTADGSSVSVIEPGGSQPVSYPLGARCLQLAARADLVVATCATADRVVVVDAVTGAVVHEATLDTPRVAALAGQDIWVDTADGLTRLTRNLEVRAVYRDLTAVPGGDVFAADGSVWVRGPDAAISRIDAASGRLLERITPGAQLSGGSLVVAFGSIWTTAGDEGRVVRLRLD